MEPVAADCMLCGEHVHTLNGEMAGHYPEGSATECLGRAFVICDGAWDNNGHGYNHPKRGQMPSYFARQRRHEIGCPVIVNAGGFRQCRNPAKCGAHARRRRAREPALKPLVLRGV